MARVIPFTPAARSPLGVARGRVEAAGEPLSPMLCDVLRGLRRLEITAPIAAIAVHRYVMERVAELTQTPSQDAREIEPEALQ